MEKAEFETALRQSGLTESDLQEQLPVAFMEQYGPDLMMFDNVLERIISSGSSDDLGRFLHVCSQLIRTAAVRHEKAVATAKREGALSFWSSMWGAKG